MNYRTALKNKAERMSISERIKAIRLINNLSLSEFGAKIYTLPEDLMTVESGAISFNNCILRLISLEFGVSMEWLLTGKAEPTDPEQIKHIEYKSPMTSQMISEMLLQKEVDDNDDGFTDITNSKSDNIESFIAENLPLEKAIDLSNNINDLISSAYNDGFNSGYRNAIALVSGLLNLNNLQNKLDTLKNAI